MTSVQNRPEASEPLGQFQLLEPLVKATKKPPNLGQWGGLDIIAIGPKGGKIVGYDSAGKPIYAGSKKAEKLAQQKAQANTEGFATAGALKEWLSEVLGVPSVVGPQGKQLIVSPATAALVEQHFGVKAGQFKTSKGVTSQKIKSLQVTDLIPHLGKPLTPKTPEEAATFSAKAGAGELDNDPFPPLHTLKRETGTKMASIAAGSHGNWLFVAPDGRKFVFKKDDIAIARAEEAADRISRLILGDGKAPAAKHVELDGKPGVLLEWLEGTVLNQHSHSNPPTDKLQENFDEVVAHHVVDWLVSNHDGHAGNFLTSKDGFAAFDKGQAWKFFGHDKLSANYSPNNSKPIYVKFWNEFQAGNIKGDPVAAAKKAIEAAEKMTPEQMRQIVMPYAIERAKKEKGDAGALADQFVSRLGTLRADWEKFLTKMTGKKVVLEKEHEDNFETMPESGLSEPGAPVAMATEPTAPIQKESVPGWPQTKGGVTVFNPGSPPPPGAKWPKGYPGDGFQAQIKYKGELFTVEFMLHGGKEFGAFVHFPDGQTMEFPSPNAASDAMVLYKKGLPLATNATKKKELGISYPAGTAFGIKKFKDELAASQTTKPEDLAEKFTPLMTNVPVPPFPSKFDWQMLPIPPSGWKTAQFDALPTGTTLAQGDPNYTGVDHIFIKQLDNTWLKAPYGSTQGDIVSGAEAAASFQGQEAYKLEVQPDTVEPPPGEEYKTIEDHGVPGNWTFVPQYMVNAANLEELPQGTEIKWAGDADFPGVTFHKTKDSSGNWIDAGTGGGVDTDGGVSASISATAAQGTIQVLLPKKPGTTTLPPITTNLPTLTADWSASSWPVPEPFGPAKAGEALDSMPSGAGIKFEDQFGTEYVLTKLANGSWAGTGDGTPTTITGPVLATTLAEMASGAPIYLKAPEASETPSEDNWATMPKQTVDQWLYELNQSPPGTAYRQKFALGYRTYVRADDGSWASVNPLGASEVLTTEQVADNMGGSFDVEKLITEAPDNWETMPESLKTMQQLAQMPSGSAIKWGDKHYAKTGTMWKEMPDGSAATSYFISTIIGDDAVANEVALQAATTGDAPKIDTEAAGVDVPASAPSTFSGPLPPGSSKTVKKKFAVEKGGKGVKKLDVTLTTLDDGSFMVQVLDGSTMLGTEVFESLSAASDWVWVKQKGYQDAADYKTQTGKNKVPSGGGWKFWGIDPKAVIELEPEPVPGAANWETMPPPDDTAAEPGLGQVAFLSSLPIGAVIEGTHPSGTKTKITKIADSADPFANAFVLEYPQTGASEPQAKVQISSFLVNNKSKFVYQLPVPETAAPAEPDEKLTPETLTNWMSQQEPGFQISVQELAWAFKLPHQKVTPMMTKLVKEGKLVAKKTNAGMVYSLPAFEGAPPLTKESAKDAAVGAISGSKYDQLVEKGFDVIHVTDMKVGDPIDPDYGVGPINGAAADKLLAAGLVVVRIEGPGVEHEDAYPAVAVTMDALVDAPVGSTVVISYKAPATGEVETKIVKKWSNEKWKWVGTPDYLEPVDIYEQVTETNGVLGALLAPAGPMEGAAEPEPAGPETGDWEPLEDASKTQWKSILQAYPPGVSLMLVADTGLTTTVTKLGSGKWSVQESGAWPQLDAVESAAEIAEAMASAMQVNQFVGEAPLAPSAPSVSKVTKYPKATTILTPGDIEASYAAEQQLVKILDLSAEWQKADNPELPPPGAKSPQWPGWVPPTGVIIQGESPSGAKFWMTPVVAGFSASGEPFTNCKFVVVTEGGIIHEGGSSKSAANALKSAAKSAGFDFPIAQLKKMLGLNGALFAAGETLESIKTGSGPSSIPASVNVLDKSVPEMTPAEAAAPVKVSMTLAQAFKATWPNGHIEPGMGSKILTLDSKQGLAAFNLKKDVEAFFEGLGLLSIVSTQVTPAGVAATIPGSFTDHEVVVTLTSAEAASYPSPSQDNWETMPEGVPKILDPSVGEKKTVQILDTCPEGTMVVGTTGLSYTKKGDLWIGDEGDKWDADDLASIVSTIKAAFVPPDGTPPVPKPAPKKKKKKDAKALPAKTAEQIAKAEHAKKVAAWAKQHAPVTDEESILVLSHLQALDPDLKMRARMSPDGKVMLQPDDPADWTSFVKLMDKTTTSYDEVKDTPTETWFAFDIADLKSGIPNNAADTIEGPDGKTYPGGTTFKTKTVKTTVQESLEAIVTKIVDHKTNPQLKMVKLAGTEDEQKAELAKIAAEHGHEGAPMVTGGQYTMFQIPEADLKKVHKTEKVVVPNIPEQPPRFVSASLPSSGGKFSDGELVEQNRADLAIMDTIVTPRTGHMVRCGRHATFWNDQICVRRVKGTDGKIRYEVSGQLRDTSGLAKMEHGNFVFEDAASTKVKHYKYPQQTWDPETGAIIKSGNDPIRTMSGKVATTDAGSKVSVLNDVGKQSLHGMFKITVEEGADLEAELAEAFNAMGIDPAEALAEPNDVDERLFIKSEIVRSLQGSKGWRHSQADLRDEAKLDQMIKSAGGTKAMVENAEIRAGFNGKHVVCIKDQKDQDARVNKGCEFVYMGMSGIGSIFARIKEGQGLWSNRAKWMGGVEGSETSVESDHSGGGTSVAFCRMGNVNADGDCWGLKGGNGKFIIHPRVLERTDWVGFTGDSYGHWASTSSPGRKGAYSNKQSSNEVDFEDGVSEHDIAGILVHTQGEKQQLISWCHAEGITEINGMPLEDFIFIESGNSRSAIVDKCLGLKDGVLP